MRTRFPQMAATTPCATNLTESPARQAGWSLMMGWPPMRSVTRAPAVSPGDGSRCKVMACDSTDAGGFTGDGPVARLFVLAPK